MPEKRAEGKEHAAKEADGKLSFQVPLGSLWGWGKAAPRGGNMKGDCDLLFLRWRIFRVWKLTFTGTMNGGSSPAQSWKDAFSYVVWSP